ncbi:MAG: hypothetical protein J1F36_00090 [Clostridiales bacterium]|nr:hypothetical protein [Clostridiales bacterium]
MELMTPQILWKDFDTQAPLDETVLRYVDDEGRKIKEFYFSGLRTSDGVVRIFARYLHNGDNLPTIIFFGDEDDSLKIPHISRHNFLVVDYTGVKKDKIRGTMYPYSLKDAQSNEPVYGLPPKSSRWYAWASVAMHAVLYAQRHCGNGKIGVIGIGQGGSLVWKLSACVNVDAGVTLFSTGYEPNADDLNYRACLDNRSYAPILKFPVIEIVSSNEGDGSIDFMSEIFANIKRKDCRLCINERSNHTLGEAGKHNIELWLRHYLEGDGNIPETPILRPYESEGKMYFEVKYPGNPEEIELFVSIGNVHGAERNWSNVKTMKLGDGYLAPVNVYDINAPINAYVTIKECGYKISSILISRVPAKMGVAADSTKHNRLIYDSDMGIDDWAHIDNEKPVMKEGPFGIDGVYASKPLVTFKLADIRFRGTEGGLLQVMFCSRVKQTIKFAITDSKKRTFVCPVEGDFRQGWVTKNFVEGDFKMQNEALAWKDIVTFEVIPESGPVLISSLLWV